MNNKRIRVVITGSREPLTANAFLNRAGAKRVFLLRCGNVPALYLHINH